MKKTPLFSEHKSKGARFVNFAGWQMPFAYTSPALEHHQVRQTGGLFDVSHMGQIRIKGKDSLAFLSRLLPSNLKPLQPGQALYSVLCREDGGLLDDLILYVCSPKNYLLCVNAACKDKNLNWIKSQYKKEELVIQDESLDWALIAVQGPRAFDLCEKVFPTVSFKKIPRFCFAQEDFCLFSRTGYTGEEGFEIYIPSTQAQSIWGQLLKEGQGLAISPIGLGARDTLRLEMAYLLSGQDFDETKSPLQAGLSWLLKSEEDYIGRPALLKQKAGGDYSTLKAFVMEESVGIPRKSYSVYSEKGKVMGEVTSGVKSPSLEKMIGLAYLKEGAEEYFINIRGLRSKIYFTSKPFFKKNFQPGA